MGTKIQANAFLREYHSGINSDRNRSSGRMPVYDENRVTTNVQNLGSFPNFIYSNSYLGYDLEKMRRTILDHESIFRYQLQELHRLYGRQRELMQERLPKLPQARDTELCLRTARTSACRTDALTLGLASKSFFEDSQDVMTWGNSANSPRFGAESRKKHLLDDFADKSTSLKHGLVGDRCSGKSIAFPQFQLADPRKENSNYPLGTREVVVSSRKRKIFGVEILEENNDPPDAAPNASNSFHITARYDRDNLRLGPSAPPSWPSKSVMLSCELGVTALDDGRNESSCQKGLSIDMNGKWLRGGSSVESNLFKVPHHSAESPEKSVNNLNSPDPKPAESVQDNLPWFLRKSQEKRNASYFMNLDSLQNHTHSFFQKAETGHDTSELNQENEIPNKRITGFPVSDTPLHISEDINSGNDTNVSGVKHHIDLNLSLDEEDASQTILSYGQSDKNAAETMIAISLSTKENSADITACDPSEGSSSLLHWLAEIVSSECGETDSIPDALDHFEWMTLKLEDSKDKQHYNTYQPMILENPKDDEKGKGNRARRGGQTKRGRQKRDFQRDILPGLVTLSRAEITEDLQAFEELMKSQGRGLLSQRGSSSRVYNRARKCMVSRRGSSSRNIPARKRMVSSPRTPPKAQKPPAVCQLRERSLVGWGKRTRRLPRQRCLNGFLSFAIRC